MFIILLNNYFHYLLNKYEWMYNKLMNDFNWIFENLPSYGNKENAAKPKYK